MPDSGFITLDIQITGVEPLQRRIQTWGANIANAQPLWEEIGQHLLDEFGQQFASEGGMYGGGGPEVYGSGVGWVPLSTNTVKERLRKGYGGEHPILERTGKLRMEVTQKGTPGNVFEATGSGITVGTSDPIGFFHQMGSADNGIRLPRRTIVGINWQQTRPWIVNRIRQWAQQQAAEQGLAG